MRNFVRDNYLNKVYRQTEDVPFRELHFAELPFHELTFHELPFHELTFRELPFHEFNRAGLTSQSVLEPTAADRLGPTAAARV